MPVSKILVLLYNNIKTYYKILKLYIYYCIRITSSPITLKHSNY